MNRKLILSLLIAFVGKMIYAQSSLPSVSFKTPEVSAFNRNIEVPVSHYTGVPNISIPLYEISIKGVSVPVVLNYHAGGIRVDQEATWVGLGWSLDYGGQISRKVRGVQDELYFYNATDQNGGSINYYMNLPGLQGSPSFEITEPRYERISAAKRRTADYLPDEFFFSAPGYSGKFLFNQSQHKFVLFPKDDLKIEQTSSADGRPFHSWQLRLPNGVQVTYGEDAAVGSQGGGDLHFERNSWLAKKIKNVYNEEINYAYDNFSYTTWNISGADYKFHHQRVSLTGGDVGTQQSSFQDRRINSISFPGGQLKFLTVDRDDMPTKALSEVQVLDHNNRVLKRIVFTYSYFTGDSFDISQTLTNLATLRNYNHRSKRLRLDKVEIQSASGAELQQYSFDYYTSSQLPSKYSFAQDHWGYFNGMPNMSVYSLIPKLSDQFVGGNRKVVPTNAQLFSLKSITYPEKGRTEIKYESNTANLSDIPENLISTYEDENFVDKSAMIYVSGYSRSSNFPSADQTSNGTRYFTKTFEVTGAAYSAFGNNWQISTNFGLSYEETNSTFTANNVEFKLERINPDGSRTFVKSFNTTDVNYPTPPATTRRGEDAALFSLAPGNYVMTVAMTYLNSPGSPGEDQPYNLSFTIKWRERQVGKNEVYVGGLRTKQLEFYDSNNTLVMKKEFKYIHPNGGTQFPNMSSGRVISFPQYLERRYQHYTKPNGVDDVDYIDRYVASSILPLETTTGSYSGYEYVDELDVDVANPQSVMNTKYEFSFNRPYYSEYFQNYKKGLIESQEWTRGKIKSKTFLKNGLPILREDFTYFGWSPHLTNGTDEDFVDEINTNLISFQELLGSCSCLQFEQFPDDTHDTDIGPINCLVHYYSLFDNNVLSGNCQYNKRVPYFKHYTGFDKIASKTTKTFNEDGSYVMTSETFNYDRTPVHHQVTKTTKNSSDGVETSESNLYPLDFIATGSEEIARQNLVNNHRINIPIVVSTKRNQFQENVKAAYELDLATNTAVMRTQLTNSRADGDYEVRSSFDRYDNKGNLLQVSQPGGSKKTYLYSYAGLYPVIQIQGLSYENIANLLGATVIANLQTAANPSRADLETLVSQIRVAFPESEVSFFTYNMLIGISSQTDAKGKTVYYEYDEFNRLKTVKDQDGNVLKSYNYHYKN